MMAIDPHHPLIVDTLTTLLRADIDPSTINMKIPDYDGTLYLLAGISDSMIAFIMQSEEVKSIGEAGGYEALDNFLQGFQIDRTAPNQYSVIIDKSQLPTETEARKAAVAQIADKFSLLRTTFLSGPFFKAIAAVKQGLPFQAQQVNIRKNEKLWVIPAEGRVTFVFQIVYKDSNDASFARIFLQEFQDSKKKISNAPVISFGTAPPENISQYRPKTEGLFLSLTILRDQITNPVEQAKCLSGFRQYLTYHIHASKTYLHMRMRKRTEVLHTALKQAVPEKLEEKTFKRVRAMKGIKEEAKIINNFKS